jgi:hypothetical protein
MRSLMAAAIVVALAGSAYAQGMPPIGIPMGGDKSAKPVDPVKENEYNSAIKGLPTQKGDPWGNIRQSPPAPAAKKAPGAADKTTPAAKKKSATAKNADAPKKTN